MALNRRQLIHRGAAGAGLVVVGNLTSLFTPTASAAPLQQGRRAAAGADLDPSLVGDRLWRADSGPGELLDLPDGFTYKVISEAGAPLTGADGTLPDAFDGTALFEIDGRRFLIRNSEQGYTEEDEPIEFPAVAAPEFTYDPAAMGGTTTTELDADNNVVAEYVSLAGTTATAPAASPRGAPG